jgi:hypothetical protein
VKTWVLALLTLFLTAGAHQYHEYDEFREFPCSVLDAVIKDYEYQIWIIEFMGWGEPKEVWDLQRKLNTAREIRAYVCKEI